MRKLITAAFLYCLSIPTHAQQNWNLKSIVEYAMAHNTGVKLSEVQAKIAAITLNQSKLSQYPSASFSGSLSLNSGSNQDPISFNRITETYLSSGLQLQSSADIFNFYSKRNTIAANDWELQAAKANTDKLRNDIALTAANAYLQILLAREQEKITLVQVQQTSAQLSNTRKQVDAGALPELNAAQLEAQLSLDSVNYLTAKGNVTQAILTLKSYMNIDAASPFEVDAPPVEMIPLEAIADLQPDNVYALAMANQPLQRYNELRLKAAAKSTAAARAFMYPTLSAFGSLGSGYNNQVQQITGITGTSSSQIGTVNVNGVNYNVVTPRPEYSYSKTNFPSQLSDNFRQSIGLSLSVPIFNGGNLRGNYEKTKLSTTSLEIQKEQDDQKLKQDIYSAYTAAVIALEKFNAGKKSVEINERAFNYANKRFEVGMLSTYDLITTQNNVLRAKLEYTLNRFDYVFKMKVLEFYKGLGLKL